MLYGFRGVHIERAMQFNSCAQKYEPKRSERRGSPEDLFWKDMSDPNEKDNLGTTLAPVKMEIKVL